MEYKLQGWCGWHQRFIYNSSCLVKYPLRISIVEGNSDENKRVLYFFINIGMVLGLVPTIGIPLPFFSYGGSSLLGFVLLISIYIRLDSERTSKW